ncbi:MAG: hypothetical protein KDA47_05625 [Planctomycetales bacterium]|nr:hypothetical protein [Planctomycetales bacterium]
MRHVVVCIAVLSCWLAASSLAAEPQDLPLSKVVLFDVGVGYFEHAVEIKGTEQRELRFDVRDINDLLKSMVVQDAGGGHVEAVVYPSQHPLSERMKALSIDLTTEPTLGEIINQMRGERVVVATKDGPLEGTVVAVELKYQAGGTGAVAREHLGLLTETGLRSMALDAVDEIRIADERLNGQFRDALRLLAENRKVEKKPVTFRFVGDGARQVRVGYIRQTPLWKTTYRLVLNDGEPALLQGWAIIENSADDAWQDIGLTLASGRPVTFEMDLYRTLLADRQRIAPSVPESIASRVHSPALGDLDSRATVPAIGLNVPQAAGPGAGGGMGGMAGGAFGGGGMVGGYGGGGFGGAMGGAGNSGYGNRPFATSVVPIVPGDVKVPAQAESAEIAQQFQYRIKRPVSLASHESALVPIVDESVQADVISLLTMPGNSEHPMRAVRLTNSTELQLVGGPVTVFDQGAYAGDARFDFFPAGDKRLLSFARDIDVRVKRMETPGTREMTAITVRRGSTVYIDFLTDRIQRYRAASVSETPRKLVIEHPKPESPWSLRPDTKPWETTDSHNRFEVTLPAEKTVEFDIVEQRSETETYVFGASPDSYPKDAVVRIAPLIEPVSRSLEQIKVNRGELQLAYRFDRKTAYRASNRDDKPRAIHIEHPKPQLPWQLHSDMKPVEQTESFDLFRFEVEAGKTASFEIVEQQNIGEVLELASANYQVLADLLPLPGVTDEARQAIEAVIKIRRELETYESTKRLQEQTLQDVVAEQTRIRQNMDSLDRDSDLYRGYVAKLTEQETQLEQVRERIRKLRSDIQQTQSKLDEQFPRRQKESGTGLYPNTGFPDPFGARGAVPNATAPFAAPDTSNPFK